MDEFQKGDKVRVLRKDELNRQILNLPFFDRHGGCTGTIEEVYESDSSSPSIAIKKDSEPDRIVAKRNSVVKLYPDLPEELFDMEE